MILSRLLVAAALAWASPAGATAPVPASAPASAPAAVEPTATADWIALSTEDASDWSFLLADGTVHQALQRWARVAGWQLVWEVDRDFPIDAEVSLRGNFLAALTQAMAALRDTDFPLQARVQAQTRVVRIGRWLPDGARR